MGKRSDISFAMQTNSTVVFANQYLEGRKERFIKGFGFIFSTISRFFVEGLLLKFLHIERTILLKYLKIQSDTDLKIIVELLSN